jgi:hypothetical protein
MKKRSGKSVAELADAAFREATESAIERAEQTGTRVIVCEDGKIKRLKPAEARALLKKNTARRARKKLRG